MWRVGKDVEGYMLHCAQGVDYTGRWGLLLGGCTVVQPRHNNHSISLFLSLGYDMTLAHMYPQDEVLSKYRRWVCPRSWT